MALAVLCDIQTELLITWPQLDEPNTVLDMRYVSTLSIAIKMKFILHVKYSYPCAHSTVL